MHHTHALSRLCQLTPPAAMTALATIATALDSMDDRDALAALAAALPRRVAALAPEVSVAVCRIATRLVEYGAHPPDDVDDLMDAPRTQWLRLRVIAGGTMPASDDLKRVVSGWSVDALITPRPFLQALANAEDPTVRFACMDWLSGALAGVGISVGEAFDLSADLAGDSAWAVRIRALTSAEFGVRSGLSLQQESRREDVLLAGLRASETGVTQATLQACAQLGRADWLRDFANDESRPVHLRAEALAAVGDFAESADLPWALALARTPGLEEACRRCLLDAHRQGAFLTADTLDALLGQYDHNTAWTPTDLVLVTHVVRDALIARMARLPANDLRWRRRADVLAQSGVDAAPRLIERLLTEVTDLRSASALIEAAQRSPGFGNTDVLLTWLHRLPSPTAFTLRFVPHTKAQRAAIEKFAKAPTLGTVDRATLQATLAAQRHGALMTLTTPPAEQAGPASNRARPQSALVRLKALSVRRDAALMPQVSALFRSCVTRCVREALAGDFSVKRMELPAIEQEIYRYGRGLIAAGYCLRGWSTDTAETGRDLLLGLICAWLDEGPERAVMVAVLEMAARHAPTGHWLRRIERFWRATDREVQRAAVDAILAAGEAAAGLALSLSRLVEAPSPRIAERGLEAIEAFEAKWAESLVIAALTRPEMAVKRAAAGALRVVASAAAVPTILEWLARHDNRALRAALKAALKTAAGTARPALLIAAYQAQTDPRRRRLLLDALGGLLPMAGLLRLLSRGHACADAFIDAALDGRLALTDATQAQVAARLHRARVREAQESDDPTADFRVRGFTAGRARAMLIEWMATQDARCLAAVRQRMAEWLAWCPSCPPDLHDAAAELALRSASRAHPEMLDALLDLAPRVCTAVVLPFINRCMANPTPGHRQRAIELLRTLPLSPEPGGFARFESLRALGAISTRADVWRCLQECAMGPHFAQRSRSLLMRALQLSKASAIPALVDGATDWHQLADAERAGWLDEALRVRPLGVPPLADPPRAPVRAPLSTAALVAALTDLRTRDAAAQALVARPTAIAIWPDVLAQVLSGAIEAPALLHGPLARALVEWPTDPVAEDIAIEWIDALDRAQLRTFIPGWIARRAQGDARAEACLRATDDGPLLPFVWAGKSQDPTLVRLLALVDVDSEHRRALLDWLKAHAPDEATRFKQPEFSAPESTEVDPIAGLDQAGLRRLIEDRESAVGLTVRAVHALAASGNAAIEPLASMTVDERPKVRSAALRALRRVASRERSLQASCAALRMEDRHDVILQLMRSLGHGQHMPALPQLIAWAVHRKLRLAEGARDALLGFGEAALPALTHAARRARPDRRDVYRALIAAIEG